MIEALIVLACWRLTHLITDDMFPPIRWAREKVVNRNPEGALAYLAECTFCVSVYTGALGAVAAWKFIPEATVPELWLAWPALSATTVFIEALVSRVMGDN